MQKNFYLKKNLSAKNFSQSCAVSSLPKCSKYKIKQMQKNAETAANTKCYNLKSLFINIAEQPSTRVAQYGCIELFIF